MPTALWVQAELFAPENSLEGKRRDIFNAASPFKREKLPTNTTTDNHPVHRWFNFIAGFSPEFVHECCASTQGIRFLLDPFGGCGTAALVAKQRGINSISFDPHPIFSRIARAKLEEANSNDVDRIERLVLAGLEDRRSPRKCLSEDSARFLAKLFDPDVLESLLGARAALLSSSSKDSNLGFLMLSKVVEMSTHSQTDGIYKAPSSKRRAASPKTSCAAVARTMRQDMLALGSRSLSSLHTVHDLSSTDMSLVADRSIDIVVTSPPYLNNFDYAEMTRMLLYFWGIATSWGDITMKVRSQLIVNTTTALKGQKEKQSQYRACLSPELRRRLDPLVKQLSLLRTQKPGKKEYNFLIYPYFAQMTEVLRECHRCLKPDAAIHVMVADAAFYGVHISTPEFLTEIMSDIGFRGLRCELVRTRGNRWVLAKRAGSSKGLGEYHISGTR